MANNHAPPGVQARVTKLREQYRSWKRAKFDNHSGFFPVWSDFRHLLPRLSGGALKLYLFFGLVSKNETGESWYSNKRIAEELGCSERAVQEWAAELRKLGLIERVRHTRHGVAYTYLRPYGGDPSQEGGRPS